MRAIFIASFLSILMLFSGASVASSDELKIGDVAPTFELVDQFNQRVSLESEQGKWVVLYFYPKNDTPGCTTEACSFRDNINKLIAQKAVILGVSVDDQASHVAFAKKYNLPFSLLADEEGKVAAQYGAILDLKFMKFAKRHSFIIDPLGKIVKIYRSVDPDNHVREVMADLKALQAKAMK